MSECSLCGSSNTNKSNCPLNPTSVNPSSDKHPLAGKSQVLDNNNKKEHYNTAKAITEEHRCHYYDNIEIYWEAFNRGLIDFDTPIDFDELCKLIESELPSQKWLDDSYEVTYRTLPSDIRSHIDSYRADSTFINADLRARPKTKSPINDIIETVSIPLPNDIVVYRYVTDDSFLPDRGEFISNGYLSTSWSANNTISLALAHSRKYGKKSDDLGFGVILEIHIPKGAKAINLGSEYELLFPHGIKLFIHGKFIRDMLHGDKIKPFTIYKIQVCPEGENHLDAP